MDGPGAGDRGDLKSTSYEFFMLAMATLSPPEPKATETTPELAALRELLDQQEETTALLRAKVDLLEASSRR